MTDFQVIKPISKGAFGKVYLCRRRKFPDLFAVKVLPKIQSSLKTDVTQVLKERRIMSNLFSFQSESSLFLVMDFMPGGDLFSLLQNVGALAEEPSRFYIAEILHAIRYLHSHGKKKKIERENNLAGPFFKKNKVSVVFMLLLLLTPLLPPFFFPTRTISNRYITP
jgi:serine/threonine protein kinase